MPDYYHPIIFKNLSINGNIFAAPMAGITNLPTRILFQEFGADLTFTEMISANGIVYNDKKTLQLLKNEENDNAAVQIFGYDPIILKDAFQFIEENTSYKILNLNLGCPVKKILKSKSGGYLLQNPELIQKIISTITLNIKLPFTIKIRSGFDSNNINFLRIGKIAEEYNVRLIILHPRTVKQLYNGLSNWDHIKQLKKNLTIPVIGNGDITTPELALKMIKETECDGIMIGRGAIGNPWLFKMSKKFLQGNYSNYNISTEERINIMLKHLTLSIKFFGEEKGIKSFRTQMLHYLKNFPNSAKLRKDIQTLIKFNDIILVLKKYNLK